MMSTESLKTLDVSSVDRAPTHEELTSQVIWEDILNSALVRLDLLKHVRKIDTEGKIIRQVQDILLAMGRREKVDFDTFRDLLASIGIEVVLFEEFVTQKKEETEVAPASEAAVSEAVPEQPMQTPADPLGFSRKTPEFSAPVVEAKPVSQVAQSELLEQTPAPVVEGVSTQEVSGSTPEDAGVTLEDIRAMIDASYSHLSPEDREKVYEAARKELGL